MSAFACGDPNHEGDRFIRHPKDRYRVVVKLEREDRRGWTSATTVGYLCIGCARKRVEHDTVQEAFPI